jgi:PAS domain-containing protein
MRATPLVWVSCGLVSLTISVMLAGDWLVDLAPAHDRQVFESRRDLAESLAVQYSALATREQIETVKFAMEVLSKRNPNILSLALLQKSGMVVAQVGDHKQVWVQPPGEESTLDFLQVPILSGDKRWGSLQVAFRKTNQSGLQRFLADPWVRFLAFVSVAGFVGYLFFMKRTFRQLDPSGTIPTRIKTALDGLTEGVVMIDTRDKVILANNAFCRAVSESVTSLIGSDLGTLSWKSADQASTLSTHPWTAAIVDKQPQTNRPLLLSYPDSEPRKFVVNSVPIMDDASVLQGALVSFYDVTDLDRSDSSLREAISEVESSHIQIREKNQELETMNMRLQAETSERKKAQAEIDNLHQQLSQVLRNAGLGNAA